MYNSIYDCDCECFEKKLVYNICELPCCSLDTPSNCMVTVRCCCDTELKEEKGKKKSYKKEKGKKNSRKGAFRELNSGALAP